jgi:hypothetical protein
MANTSAIATSVGTVSQVPDLQVPVNRIFNFVERMRKAYFEEHGLDWCLDEIITRGIAEITRQVKTAQVRIEQKAAGDLLKAYNMTPREAAEFLKKALADAKQQPTVVK